MVNYVASQVKTARISATADTTKATLKAATSGKQIQLISLYVKFDNATALGVEVYFGDGTNITSNTGKEIFEALMDLTDSPNAGMVWPDGAGPIGAPDDEVTHRATGSTGTITIIIVYREL